VVIKLPPNCKHLATYIIYLLQTAVFTILEQGSKWTRTTFIYTELPLYTVGNKELFTLSQLHLWITNSASHPNQGGSFHMLMMHFRNLLGFMQSHWDVPENN